MTVCHSYGFHTFHGRGRGVLRRRRGEAGRSAVMAALRCVAAAAVPAWGARALPPLGAGGRGAGRLRRRDAVLCPPPRVFRGQNFESWCRETGREELLGEWDDPDMRSEEVPRGSQSVTVRWKCRSEECGHTWHTSPGHRTGPKGTGCPSCGGKVVTATNNLAAWCGKNRREDVLAEWAHPDKAPEEFTQGSAQRVPWTCRTCGHGWAAIVTNRGAAG